QTAHCNDGAGSAETVTQYFRQEPTTVYTTVRRVTTVAEVTSQGVTTVEVDATCHWPAGGPPAQQTDSQPPQPSESRPDGCDTCRPTFRNGGWGWGARGGGGGGGNGGGRGGGGGGRGGGGGGRGGGGGGGRGGGGGGRGGGGGGRGGGGRGGGGRGGGRGGAEVEKRAVVVVTSTVYDTHTVTSTSVVTAKATTTVETSYVSVLKTITAPAQTVCDADPGDAITVVSLLPQETETDVSYITVQTVVTQWVGQTQYTTHTDYNVASACSRGGGWYGA
ncbi:hypothetical protein QBC33DRAFT_502058, partial [Phialemonium atrogriseum]